VHRIASDLDEHIAVVSIETNCGHGRFPDVTLTQLRGAAGGEIEDAVLRLESLIKVLMTGEYRIDAVLQEQRLELRPEILLGAVAPARLIQRVMKEWDLPVRT
jgi:hypothetical protein